VIVDIGDFPARASSDRLAPEKRASAREETAMPTNAHPWIVDQAAMYTAYHRDHRNVMTHVVGVPAIVFAIVVLARLMPIPFLAEALVIGFAIFYVRMQALAGALTAAGLVLALMISGGIASLGTAALWIAFVVFFVGGWIIQLVGHSLYEGRRPALADNLLQIFVAPMFLVFEALFATGRMLDLRDEIERRSHAHDLKPVAAE
jgi:uncharacterized membrane protein YGL010W